MVETEAPMRAASSWIEAAPSARSCSRIIARRLARMMSTRFVWLSIAPTRCCRQAAPGSLGADPFGPNLFGVLLPENKQAAGREGVAQPERRHRPRQIGRGAAHRRPGAAVER